MEGINFMSTPSLLCPFCGGVAVGRCDGPDDRRPVPIRCMRAEGCEALLARLDCLRKPGGGRVSVDYSAGIAEPTRKVDDAGETVAIKEICRRADD